MIQDSVTYVLINCLNIDGFVRIGTLYNHSGFPEYEIYRSL